MRFITLPNGRRINADQIISYRPDQDCVIITMSVQEIRAEVSIDTFDRLLKDSRNDILSERDHEALALFARKVTEFSQAVLRMPTSVRMRI